jgi:serine/threonine protein kinase/Tol biopolymer transport system component
MDKVIAQYQMLEKLGAGGMGVVYKARDTRLDRYVALKILPHEKLTDAESKHRFIREAKAASALNHTNIVTIYDINEADGVQYIAMEYVQGSNLHQLIRDGKLTLGHALKYAEQIASGLAAAHEAGIIHRDLKPANIMVTDRGVVKILDFGLAKLSQPTEPESVSEVALTRSMYYDPGPLTGKGTALGTAAYMSPEQATGKSVDARADIFSFGAVLYEMATGRRAFRGRSTISTLGAILHKDPDPVSAALPGAPRELERIINRCLKKDREFRFQHIDDVRIALLELQDEMKTGSIATSADLGTLVSRQSALQSISPSEAAELISQLSMIATPPPPRSRRKLWVLSLAGAVLLVAGTFALWKVLPFRGVSEEPVPAVRLTSDPGLSTDPAISPDGKVVVYASDRTGQGNLTLWIRQVAGGEPVRLTSGTADDHQPSFSPDGTRVAFRSEREGGGIYIISSLGGEPRLVASHGRNPRFSPDGKQLAYWVGDQQSAASLHITRLDGASGPVVLTDPGLQARFPVWSPDGKHLLFVGHEAPQESISVPQAGQLNRDAQTAPPGSYDWWVISARGGAAVPTGAFELLSRQGVRTSYSLAPGAWVNDSIFFSAGYAPRREQSDVGLHIVNPNDAANLWQIKISPALRVLGRPRRLTFGTGFDAAFSISSTGAIVFATLAGKVNIWSLPAQTQQAKLTGDLQPLTEDLATDSYPSISTDGKRMVFWSDRSGNADIWFKKLDTGKESQLTFDPAFETFPMIAPDGSAVAYAVADDPKYPSIARMTIGPDGSPGPAQKVCDKCGNLSDFSADGRLLYYNDPTYSIISLNPATGVRTRISQREHRHLADPRFSPDGRWVAFHTIVSPVLRQIVIAPEPGLAPDAEWIPITDGKAMERLAAWSPDGGMLYYVSEADGYRCIAARRLDPQTKRPVDSSFYVYHFHGARRTMMNFANVNMARLSISRDRIVFSLGERSGNLWLTRLN